MGHGGDLDSYHTYVGYLPDQKLGVIVLSNWHEAVPCYATLRIFDHLVPEKKEEPGKKNNYDKDFSSFEGSYITEDGLQFQVYSVKGDLYLQFFGEGPVTKLKQVAGSEFSGINRRWCTEYKISFTKNKKEKIEGEIQLYGKSSFKRTSLPSEMEWKPVKSELQIYEGKYYSADLKTRFTITADENQLFASNENHEKIILTPKTKDVFSGNQWYLNNMIFTRTDEEKINSMLVSGFRFKNIPFKKL